MSGYLLNLYKKHSEKKEFGAENRPRRLHQQKPESSNSFEVRREPLQKSLVNNELYEEEVGASEILIPESEQFNIFKEVVVDNVNENVLANGEEVAIPSLTFCPSKVGFEHFNTPVESMDNFQKRLDNVMLGRLVMDFSTSDAFIQSGDPYYQELGYIMRGSMLMMNNLNEKLLRVKPDSATSELVSTFSPLACRNMQEEVTVKNLDESGMLSVNTILSEIPAQSGTLRTVVNTVCNHWIGRVIPKKDHFKYTTSPTPQFPQLTIPAQFLNGPLNVLVHAITTPGADPETISVNIGLLFKAHLTNVCNNARCREKKRKGMEEATTAEETRAKKRKE